VDFLLHQEQKNLLSNRVTASFPRIALLHGLDYRFVDALCNKVCDGRKNFQKFDQQPHGSVG